MDLPWMSGRVTVRESPIDGCGIFAASRIEAGEPLLDWGLGLRTKREIDRLGLPSMRWDEDLFSVDDGTDADAYRINHSCEPNAWMNGMRVVARRSIEAGEEITTDYALWSEDPGYVSEWVCHCGSSLCRGRVTGNDWRDPSLQKRYRGHFSPLLNKRIDRTVI